MNPSNTDFSTMEKMNIAQVIILILLGIERLMKLFINSKCLKKLNCRFLGYNFINFETEEQTLESPRNNKDNKDDKNDKE